MNKREKKLLLAVSFFLIFTATKGQTQMDGELLWYNQPARNWNQALPIGNGHLGAMIFGDPVAEHFQLNEDSMWPDADGWGNMPGNAQDLAKVRKLLFKGENKQADSLFMAKFSAKDVVRSHQTMGDLYIHFLNKDIQQYRRELDLSEAVFRASFKTDKMLVTEQAIASNPDDGIFIFYQTTGPEGLSGQIAMSRPEDNGHATAHSFTQDSTLVMQGEVTQYGAKFNSLPRPITHGVKFDTRIKVDGEGGEIVYKDSVIEFRHVRRLTIYLSCKTSFYEKDFVKVNKLHLDEVFQKPFARLLTRHMADYKKLYDRVRLQIDHHKHDEPTDMRLTKVKQGGTDIGLEEMLFNYGRYLLIACSRKGTNPANLQGLWNDKIQAAWNADYHMNINLQMNYWLADVTNLGELNEPLFHFIDRAVEVGEVAAKENYGCRGSVFSHATDLWTPAWLRAREAFWGGWLGAGGWMMLHLWEHYLFTGDKVFLKKQAFYDMQDVAKFYSDWLIKDPRDGTLITAPSSSPENSYYNSNGQKAALCLGSAMGQQIIHQLFTNYLRAAEIIGVNNAWTRKIRSQLPLLRSGIQLGSDGRILEWDRPYEEVEPGHRHMSHLYAFFPGSDITNQKTPVLVEAVKKTVAYRLAHGGGGPGWSRSWMINMNARMLEGDTAQRNINVLLKHSIGANMFDIYPPFQIDANFGVSAGIAEMLIQSHEDHLIRILPALPSSWKTGNASGLKARGNITASIQWQDGKVVKVRLSSPMTQSLTVLIDEKEYRIELGGGKPWVFNA